MDRVLTLEFVRVTETAAVRLAASWGRATRWALTSWLSMACIRFYRRFLLMGLSSSAKSEMDEAPMLYID